MPLLAGVPTPAVCPVTAVVPAAAGYVVTAGSVYGPVVAWACLADPQAPGGIRVDPVFLAAGRAWTPDQFRAATGTRSAVYVTAL